MNPFPPEELGGVSRFRFFEMDYEVFGSSKEIGTMLSFEYVRCDKTGDAAGKGKTGDATGKTGDTASSGNKTGDTASSGKGKEGGTDNKGKGKGADSSLSCCQRLALSCGGSRILLGVSLPLEL